MFIGVPREAPPIVPMTVVSISRRQGDANPDVAYSYGDLAAYTCPIGHALNLDGDVTSVKTECQANQTWSPFDPDEPICIRM